MVVVFLNFQNQSKMWLYLKNIASCLKVPNSPYSFLCCVQLARQPAWQGEEGKEVEERPPNPGTDA